MAATNRSQTTKRNQRSGGSSSTSRTTTKFTNAQWTHLMKTLQPMKPAAARGQAKRSGGTSSRTSSGND